MSFVFPAMHFGRDFPLDYTTNLIHAWSLRKVVPAYSGSAIRIRRSNDNAESDIGFAGNGDLSTSSITSFVGSNSAFITTIYDQGLATAINLVQTTAANQFQIVNAGTIITSGSMTTGKPVAQMTTSTSMTLASSLPSITTATFISAYHWTGSGTQIFRDDTAGGANRILEFQNGTPLVIGTNSALSPALNVSTPPAARISAATYQTTASRIKAGTQTTSGTLNSLTMTTMKLGAYAAGGLNFPGFFGEKLMYNPTALTHVDQVFTAMKSYWGV